MNQTYVTGQRHRHQALRLLAAFIILVAGVVTIQAQANSAEVSETTKKPAASGETKKPETTDERIAALEQLLEQQNARLDQLQRTVSEQQATIRLLAGKFETQPTTANVALSTPGDVTVPQTPSIDDRLKKVEGRVAEIGAIKFSGDVRLRAESIWDQENTQFNGDNSAVLGNVLSPRHRMRVRARFQMRGAINDEWEWGLRLATGSFADNISTNQTLTDFFNRKPFGLDQAFITYKPKAIRGLRLQGGRFEPPWVFTEMTIDNDLMVDGFNESYTHSFKKSAVKDLTFVAWQLPMLERNSAFVRNANGTINIQDSRRGGRDLALYGGEVRARVEPNDKVAMTLSASDLFFSGTQFISPVQVFGNQLFLPLTFTIPATATTPAQIITTQVSVPRDLLVAGNGNLGLTNASNNAVNRDGRLSSGYNLVDLLGKVELKQSKHYPVTLLANFVINTQVHDVVVAGPGGENQLVPNNENKGFWGEIQVGTTKARGDKQFGYTFFQIEKDAVLTPFNFSDVTQQSDARYHRFSFSYAADARITLQATGIVTQRLHNLLGPFTFTPPGSLNRSTFRLQLDTILKF